MAAEPNLQCRVQVVTCSTLHFSGPKTVCPLSDPQFPSMSPPPLMVKPFNYPEMLIKGFADEGTRLSGECEEMNALIPDMFLDHLEKYFMQSEARAPIARSQMSRLCPWISAGRELRSHDCPNFQLCLSS